MEIVVPVDLCVVSQRYFTKHLHKRGGSSHSTQDLISTLTGGSDCSLGQSELEASSPYPTKLKCGPLIISDTETEGQKETKKTKQVEEEENCRRERRQDRL